MADPEIKVTKINGRWHARLLEGTIVNSEMACARQEDIGYICRELLRWYDKYGGDSTHASKSRERLNTKETNILTRPLGKIWHSGYFLTNRNKK
jgi:hypothetical protein